MLKKYFMIFLFLSKVTLTIELIQLPVERWREFRQLRLMAASEVPHAVGSLEAEQNKPDLFYMKLLESSELNNGVWFVFAQDEGKLIGMFGAICEKNDVPEMQHIVKGASLYVLPEYRSQGIGKLLFTSLEKKLEESVRVRQLMLWVTTTQVHAITLYQGYGMKITGQLHEALIIDGQPYDWYLMQKSINTVASNLKHFRDLY